MMRRREEDGPSLSELDRLVMRELEALGAPARRVARPQSAQRPPQEEAGDHKVVYAHPYAEQRRPRPAESEDETVDMPDGPDGGARIVDFTMPDEPRQEGLLSADEQNFIKSATDWLRGRTNADLILEAIWSAAVAADADDGEHEVDDGAAAPSDAAEPPPAESDEAAAAPDDEEG